MLKYQHHYGNLKVVQILKTTLQQINYFTYNVVNAKLQWRSEGFRRGGQLTPLKIFWLKPFFFNVNVNATGIGRGQSPPTFLAVIGFYSKCPPDSGSLLRHWNPDHNGKPLRQQRNWAGINNRCMKNMNLHYDTNSFFTTVQICERDLDQV